MSNYFNRLNYFEGSNTVRIAGEAFVFLPPFLGFPGISKTGAAGESRRGPSMRFQAPQYGINRAPSMGADNPAPIPADIRQRLAELRQEAAQRAQAWAKAWGRA
jgi:hypothetical protein